MPEKKLIIFDWDDTFAEGATPAYINCYHYALAGIGVSLPPETERQLIVEKLGSTHLEIIKDLIGVNGERLAKAKELYEAYYENTFVDSVEAVSGSRQFLERLHEMGRHTLAIASGAEPNSLKTEIMPKFGIDPDWFAKIYTAYDIADSEKVKPNPHSAEVIMNEVGIGPESTLVVGDSSNDVLMAQDANVVPVVVLTGNLNRRDALGMGVKYVIKDVTRLMPVLDHLAEV